MYSISLIGMFQQFPFTCEWLNEASNKLFEFVEKPFLLIKKGEKKAENIANNENVDSEIMNNGSMIDDLNESISENVEWIEWMENTSWNSIIKPVISKITELKSTTIDQVLDEQESYSSSMCELLLDKINSKFWFENFKRSAILLIYLLLYGFIRISFWVMSWIAFIIFKILYRCRIYRISKTTKEVDEIY